jgi:tRNA modification GTPase
MACEELRMAVSHISNITGHIDTEEVLDILFRDFCIGK